MAALPNYTSGRAISGRDDNTRCSCFQSAESDTGERSISSSDTQGSPTGTWGWITSLFKSQTAQNRKNRQLTENMTACFTLSKQSCRFQAVVSWRAGRSAEDRSLCMTLFQEKRQGKEKWAKRARGRGFKAQRAKRNGSLLRAHKLPG